MVRLGLNGACQFGIRCEVRRGRTGKDDVGPGRLKPIPVLVEVGINPGRADDYVRRIFQRSVLHTLEDVFEDAGEFTPSPSVEAGGVGVTVEGNAVGNLVVPGEPARAGPANELALDGIAIRMGTNAGPAAPF